MIDLQPQRMLSWIKTCFGAEPGYIDVEERGLRFLEEALELAQVDDITREQAHALVDQVFNKPAGEALQELGGVMVTLAAYCAAAKRSPDEAFETEMERVEDPAMMAKIRSKHDTKAVVSSKIRESLPVFDTNGYSDLNPNYRVYFGLYPIDGPRSDLLEKHVLVNGVAKKVVGIEWFAILREPRRNEPIGLVFED